MATDGYEGPICPSCNIRQIKLVSISDNGKGPRICQDCKKKLQSQTMIERFDRSAIRYDEIEADLAKKAKAVVEAFR